MASPISPRAVDAHEWGRQTKFRDKVDSKTSESSKGGCIKQIKFAGHYQTQPAKEKPGFISIFKALNEQTNEPCICSCVLCEPQDRQW